MVAAGDQARAMAAQWKGSRLVPVVASRQTTSGLTRGMAMIGVTVAVGGSAAELGFEAPWALLRGGTALPVSVGVVRSLVAMEGQTPLLPRRNARGHFRCCRYGFGLCSGEC